MQIDIQRCILSSKKLAFPIWSIWTHGETTLNLYNASAGYIGPIFSKFAYVGI